MGALYKQLNVTALCHGAIPVSRDLGKLGLLLARALLKTKLALWKQGPKYKLENKLPPPDPGRYRPKTFDFQREMTVRTLPRDPPGEEGQEQNQLGT